MPKRARAALRAGEGWRPEVKIARVAACGLWPAAVAGKDGASSSAARRAIAGAGSMKVTGKGTGGGISGGEPGSDAHFVTVYVEVDEPQAYLDKAVSMGGSVAMPVTEIPGMVIFAQFKDPEGNLIGITKAGYPA